MSDMIEMEGGAGREVRCPQCMGFTEWPPGDTVYEWKERERSYVPKSLSTLDELGRREARRRGYQPCENRHGDQDEEPHFLPALYGEYEDPLVIGLIGATQAGKTHLLAAMIRQVFQGGLGCYDLEVEPLDFIRHREFDKSVLRPYQNGNKLDATNRGEVGYATSLLIKQSGGRATPVVFFDVAGEDLTFVDGEGRGGRFLVAAGGLLFVHAPDDAVELAELGFTEDEDDRADAYWLSLARVQAAPDAAELPAAIAVNKADRLRFHPPADFWLRRPAERTLQAERIKAESRDVYAYLHKTGNGLALAPFSQFNRCTLHFVSASGGDADGGKFRRGVRPLRVLEPLVSLLAMAGLVPSPEARKVGAL